MKLNEPRRTSERRPAKIIMTKDSNHKNSGFPLALFWNITNPQIANMTKIITSKPTKMVIKFKFSHNMLAIKNPTVKTKEISDTTNI